MEQCPRPRILLLVPAPGPGLTPDLALGAAPAQDPENAIIGKCSDFFFLILFF